MPFCIYNSSNCSLLDKDWRKLVSVKRLSEQSRLINLGQLLNSKLVKKLPEQSNFSKLLNPSSFKEPFNFFSLIFNLVISSLLLP